MLYRDALAHQEFTQKLVDDERDFQMELLKVLLKAIVTGKVG